MDEDGTTTIEDFPSYVIPFQLQKRLFFIVHIISSFKRYTMQSEKQLREATPRSGLALKTPACSAWTVPKRENATPASRPQVDSCEQSWSRT